MSRWFCSLALLVLVQHGVARAQEAAESAAASEPGVPEPQRARLSYDRGEDESCPDERAMRDAVSARLGYAAFAEDAALLVEVTIRRTGRSRRATLRVTSEDGRRGERTLESAGASCDELARALVPAISLAIDPLASAATSVELATPVEPSEPTECPECPECPAAEATASPVAPPPRSELRGFVGLGAQIAIEAAPQTTLGATLEGGLEIGRVFAIGLEARADLPASREARVGRGSASAHFLGGSLVPCAVIAELVSVCGVLTLGGLRGEGSGVDAPRTAVTFFATAGLRVGLTAALIGGLALRMSGEVAATLTPTTLDLSDREVWTTPPVSGLLSVRLVYFLE